MCVCACMHACVPACVCVCELLICDFPIIIIRTLIDTYQADRDQVKVKDESHYV